MPDVKRNIADIEALAERFRYDPVTGFLYRRSTGHLLGAKISAGYLCAWVGNKRIMVHRIAWALVYGEWPQELDHINRIKTDNRISNLRTATRGIQGQNTNTPKNNKTGVKGVCFCKQTGLYKATITVNRKQKWLGRHGTFDAAIAARKHAETTLGWAG